MAPASAAQLVFLFCMVMFTASGTPVLSSIILLRWYEEGWCVGNGPCVSVGASVQAPVVVVVPSFLQAFINGATATKPNAVKLFFKKFFRSMMRIVW